jgi:hypothetical protein
VEDAVAKRVAEHMGYCPHSAPEDERAGAQILALISENSELRAENERLTRIIETATNAGFFTLIPQAECQKRGACPWPTRKA